MDFIEVSIKKKHSINLKDSLLIKLKNKKNILVDGIKNVVFGIFQFFKHICKYVFSSKYREYCNQYNQTEKIAVGKQKHPFLNILFYIILLSLLSVVIGPIIIYYIFEFMMFISGSNNIIKSKFDEIILILCKDDNNKKNFLNKFEQEFNFFKIKNKFSNFFKFLRLDKFFNDFLNLDSQKVELLIEICDFSKAVIHSEKIKGKNNYIYIFKYGDNEYKLPEEKCKNLKEMNDYRNEIAHKIQRMNGKEDQKQTRLNIADFIQLIENWREEFLNNLKTIRKLVVV